MMNEVFDSVSNKEKLKAENLEPRLPFCPSVSNPETLSIYSYVQIHFKAHNFF